MAFNTSLQTILSNFAQAVGGTSNPYYQRVVAAITSSPSLELQYNTDAAVERGKCVP